MPAKRRHEVWLQLELDLQHQKPTAGRPYPALGTPIRIWQRQAVRVYPGCPPEGRIQVYDGALLAVIPAEVSPRPGLAKANTIVDRVMPLGTKKSKYDRVIIGQKGAWGKPVYYRVVTLSHASTTWRPLSECEA